MGDTTSIEWAHHTFNIWRGCAKVHAGCTHCYAEQNVGVKLHGIKWGEVWQGGQRVIAADSAWKKPMTWARYAGKAGVRRRVFCASLADVLEVPEMPPSQHFTTELRDRVIGVRYLLDHARSRLWDTIRATAELCGVCGLRVCSGRTSACAEGRKGGLDWLLLTKRPENWDLVPEDVRPLVWLGTSVSDQKTADEWGARLREAQGFRLKFYSVEPMLGPVERLPLDGIGWVIAGGESGRHARECDLAWQRSVGRQCADAGVPLFRKQLGARPVEQRTLRSTQTAPRTAALPVEGVVHPKGGALSEWPEDLRVQQLPFTQEEGR